MKELKQLLGKRIKELRQAKGYSQQELAELVNIDQRSLSYIECGGSFPSKSLIALSDALNVTLPELFNFEHLTETDTDMKIYITQSLDSLDSQSIKTIYRLIKAMR
jgi:transcriptional regulator with XRE-family HTH domain